MEEKDYQEIKDKMELEQLRNEKKEKDRNDLIGYVIGAWVLIPLLIYFLLPKILWKTSVNDLVILANKQNGWEALLQKLGLLQQTAQQWAQTNLQTLKTIGIIAGIILIIITIFSIIEVKRKN